MRASPNPPPSSAATSARRRGGTQPDPLSVDDIMQAALTLTERSGLDALTIKSVADELGITSPGVYHYVGGKQELIDRLCERVTRTIDVSTDADERWQDRIVTIMLRMDDAFARYPGVAARALSFTGPAPGALQITRSILEVLETDDAGFSRADALDVVAGLHFLFSGWLLRRGPIVDSRGIDGKPLTAATLERTTRRLLAGAAAELQQRASKPR